MKSVHKYLTERITTIKPIDFSIEKLSKDMGLNFYNVTKGYEAKITDIDEFLDKFYHGLYKRVIKQSLEFEVANESPFSIDELKEMLGDDYTGEEDDASLYHADSDAYEETIREEVQKALPAQLRFYRLSIEGIEVEFRISQEEAEMLYDGRSLKDLGMTFEIPDITNKNVLKNDTDFEVNLQHSFRYV